MVSSRQYQATDRMHIPVSLTFITTFRTSPVPQTVTCFTLYHVVYVPLTAHFQLFHSLILIYL